MTAIASPTSTTTAAARAGTARTALRLATLDLRLMLREPMVAVGLIGFPLATVPRPRGRLRPGTRPGVRRGGAR